MAGQGLTKIQPFDGILVPDPKWERVGTTPDGRQLYREKSRRSRGVPDIDPDTGKRRWALHGNTAQPLYPLNKPEHYTLARVFYIDSDGRGNQWRVEYIAPSAEQLALEERARKAEQMMPALAAALVDSGLTPAEMVARLSAPREAVPAPAPQAPDSDAPAATEAASAEPHMYGPGLWRLRDGTSFRGKKEDAIAAQAALPPVEAGEY